MPTLTQHREQATRNGEFWMGMDIQTTAYREWAVTVMFYEAVHWIEAYLATQSCHSSSHHNRSSNIARYPKLRADATLAADYDTLRVESENARYWCHQHTAAQVTTDLVPLVTHIRTTVKGLLPPQ